VKKGYVMNWGIFSTVNCQCPAVEVLPAQWGRGDGTGGTEMRIGEFANETVCYAKCSVQRKDGKLANGATVDSTTKRTCFCEFGMDGISINENWITTFIRRGMCFCYPCV